jgi:hypothetical protein
MIGRKSAPSMKSNVFGLVGRLVSTSTKLETWRKPDLTGDRLQLVKDYSKVDAPHTAVKFSRSLSGVHETSNVLSKPVAQEEKAGPTEDPPSEHSPQQVPPCTKQLYPEIQRDGC